MKNNSLNKVLFDKIYFYTANNPWAKKTAIAISKISKPLFIIIYILGIILSVTNGKGIVRILAVPFFTLVFNTTVRKILHKPRPFVHDDIEMLVEHKANGSFPSNHACSSMIISLSYLLVYPYVAFVLVVFSLFTGLSRIMIGVHYPLDIVCGWLVSIFFGITFFLIM